MISEIVRKERVKTAVRNNSTAESKAKTVANTDFAKRAEKYAQTRGTCFVIEHKDGRKFEVFGERNAAKIIGCSRGAVTKALKRDGCFVNEKYKSWSLRSN